jgi:hypothetical protein
MADCVENAFVEDGKLLLHDPPAGEQWLEINASLGECDQLADPCFEFGAKCCLMLRRNDLVWSRTVHRLARPPVIGAPLGLQALPGRPR